MINKNEFEYQLIKDNNVYNYLKWSMAGGGVRILTDILCEKDSDSLILAFISDCQKDNRTILPLSKTAQLFFDNNPSYIYLLKTLDSDYIKTQRDLIDKN